MTKSKWKCQFVNNKFYSIINRFLNRKIINKNNIYITTKFKNLIIDEVFLDCNFNIYNGIMYNTFKVKNYMFNNKLGCYCFTKKVVKHKIMKKSHKKKKKNGS